MNLPRLINRVAFTALLVATPALAQWLPLQASGSAKHLRYAAKVELLGQLTPVTVDFHCDPKSDAVSKGALGFDVFIDGAKAIPFGFDDFEGPDAPALRKNPVRAVVHRYGKPSLTFEVPASGWYANTDRFAFGVSALSSLPKSPQRSLLMALGDAGERLEIEITDLKRKDVKLRIEVPLQLQQPAFRALVAGLPAGKR